MLLVPLRKFWTQTELKSLLNSCCTPAPALYRVIWVTLKISVVNLNIFPAAASPQIYSFSYRGILSSHWKAIINVIFGWSRGDDFHWEWIESLCKLKVYFPSPSNKTFAWWLLLRALIMHHPHLSAPIFFPFDFFILKFIEGVKSLSFLLVFLFLFFKKRGGIVCK